MAKSFVLLAAMPPTIGHLHLIQFANRLADEGTVIILNTQPDEPFPFERATALYEATKNMAKVSIYHNHGDLEQDYTTERFWNSWRKTMQKLGMTTDDYAVASEPYGQKVAELVGAQFFPYDMNREIIDTKATTIREQPLEHFSDILPEFQKYLRTTITILGENSTKRSLFSRQLAHDLKSIRLFEYTNKNASVESLWLGQKALQDHANDLINTPFIIQETDLFNIIGCQTNSANPISEQLESEALSRKSDAYILLSNNNEPDDIFWTELCERYQLRYIILDSNNKTANIEESKNYAKKIASKKLNKLAYHRNNLLN